MWASFAIIGAFFIVELVAGFATRSLALLSDAGHMLTDVVGLGMALAAIELSSRFEDRDGVSAHTFGLYRLEILAALANSALLCGVAVWAVAEAVRRLDDPPEVLGVPMMLVAVAGLVANVAVMYLLRGGAGSSLNVRAAYLEVVADAIGSIGVLLAAAAWEWLGWAWADPVAGALIGVWIVPRAVRLGRTALHILMQAAPRGLDIAALRSDLVAIPGVVDVHDLHVWTLTSEMDAASVHVVVGAGVDHHSVLDASRDVIGSYDIEHGTVQVEPETHLGCDDINW